MQKIHPSAVIEDGAILGDDVVVEAYAFISKDAKIGNEVVIKQGARILADTTINDKSKVFSYAIVGDIPQDISYQDGQKGGVIIGKNSIIREFATINSGTAKGDGFTRIGDNAFIMAYCHIAHDCCLGKNVILANNATLAGHVRLDDFVVVGGLTPIHQFVYVGEGAMIAGASALSQDIVPFCLAEGNRANIRSLNLVGIRRRFDKDEVECINKAYKFLFKNGDLKEKAEKLLSQTSSKNVKKMCEFILETKRGIPVYRGKK
ncbi:acyl-ACP--UDP-N-acetylglucosamine O-acyltransferase [Campylobacter sp. MIT 97-5078]|uniref:acyl-ACP--UDP-N-acetylglucosamine O-acyltransferase n=1 Tax=Campylobacter sp. MIT 97-5078 TaxID=1548153 RepID=UPI00051369A1|nr:acyl-ACP--UDP-N-acetylglucosamine O-acyltransferase [Campylobacter sp. MIT 97-5078]KGI55379.1 UDP-N-acetylglucosamine acyltransferase [Campylobacter sp. MIT 97-5078]TQR26820.1 acyl-[acyl-carrier-protein]--UDP-N-acetylglucosamine O-acyltransferase [Campylobacter sp. MIT 97-5078]